MKRKTCGLLLAAVLLVLTTAPAPVAAQEASGVKERAGTAAADPGDGVIVQAQTLLRAAGFDPREEGVFTARTEAAIRQFQAAKDLPVTGLLDDRTRAALLDNSPRMNQA